MANRQKAAPAILIEISPGEAIDRLAILMIKAGNVKDADKLAQVRMERDVLLTCFAAVGIEVASRLSVPDKLLRVHQRLWDTENEVRQCEVEKDFGPFFLRAARRIYKYNDQRSAIKAQINKVYGLLPEVKEYQSNG